MRVICHLPNPEPIMGVSFTPDVSGVFTSDDIDDVDGAGFWNMPGFSVIPSPAGAVKRRLVDQGGTTIEGAVAG